MALSELERNKYATRVYMSRMRVLCDCGFYGILLTHMKFSIDEGCSTAYTDGERIAQMVIARHEQAEWVEVTTLDDTERGAGGFGHTGV